MPWKPDSSPRPKRIRKLRPDDTYARSRPLVSGNSPTANCRSSAVSPIGGANNRTLEFTRSVEANGGVRNFRAYARRVLRVGSALDLAPVAAEDCPPFARRHSPDWCPTPSLRPRPPGQGGQRLKSLSGKRLRRTL